MGNRSSHGVESTGGNVDKGEQSSILHNWSRSQLEIASSNVQFAGTSNVHLLQTDATGSFISSNNSVNSFGLRELSPAFAQELCR